MRVLLLTDIHGSVDKLERILSREEFDVALCAGDLGDSRAFDDYEGNLEDVLNLFDMEGKLSKAVPGNMDKEETSVRKLIEYRMNLHKKIALFQTFDAVGFGGGITPFGTPFEPSGEEIAAALDTLYDRLSSDVKVAVVHQPPKNTAVDVSDEKHVGSAEVRNLLQEKEFDLFVTGHIHEGRGTDTIGDTLIVNPGPVQDGYYAVAEIDDGVALDMKEL